MLLIAKAALLLLVLSLALPKPGVAIGGLHATATDFLFLIVVATAAVAIVKGETRLRWSNAFAILAGYFAALLVSVLVTGTLDEAAPKLASQLYLLALPVLVYALVDDVDDLKRLFHAWLAGTAICATIGAGTVLLFVAGVDRASIDYGLHYFGTLPPGNYPRIESTFVYPAMLCNYLTVSLTVLILSLHRRWISRLTGYSLLTVIMVTAAFTITPGLGGVALLLGVWLFLAYRTRAPWLSLISLVMGSLLAVAFVAVAVVAPALHPTAPFLIHLPGIDTPLAPSVRLMAWIEAGKAFLAHPVFGAGLGSDPIAVAFVPPSGDAQVLSDGHNVFLNIAMHSGLVGLAAILLLIGFVARQMRPWRLTDANAIRLGLGFAWLNAFVYQGLTGSYEDARHLWLLFGLLLCAVRLPPQAPVKRDA